MQLNDCLISPEGLSHSSIVQYFRLMNAPEGFHASPYLQVKKKVTITPWQLLYYLLTLSVLVFRQWDSAVGKNVLVMCGCTPTTRVVDVAGNRADNSWMVI